LATPTDRVQSAAAVPTLVFEDGRILIESTAIRDYLDEVVGPSRGNDPGEGPERRHA